MAITVTVPAADNLLTTRATVKTELGLTGTADDALIDSFIQQVSDAIATYCGRVFPRQTYQETVAGYGDPILMLSRTPIVSVSSVSLSGDVITDYTIEDAGAGFLYRERGWIWTAGVGWQLTDYVIPRSEAPKFTVTYIAGYYLPSAGANRNLPHDIEKAAIESVKAAYKARKRDPNVAEKKVGDLSIKWVAGSESGFLPVSALGRLEPWKRVA